MKPLAVAPAPTPIIIYVTPAPAIAGATAEPAATATTPAKTIAKPAPKPTYATVSSRGWRKIVKSPDTYVGRTFQIWACITQFDGATGPGSFLGNASYHKLKYWFSDGENAWFSGNAARLDPFVEDDIVVLKVVGTGAYSYDTQSGGNTTVPSFEVKSITRKGSCA